MILVFSAALAPRAWLFLEARNTPLTPLMMDGKTDMALYHQWAKQIADGDWLSRNPPRPFLYWNEKIARDYFTIKPSELARLGAESEKSGLQPERLLWNEWWGGSARLHWEPLYPYMVGAVYAVWGADPANVYILQIILGAAACALIFFASERIFGRRAAVFAAALAILDGSLTWGDIHLLRTTLTIFLAMLVLAASVMALEKPAPWRWAAAGAAFGLGTMAQSYFLAAGALFLAVWFWREGKLTGETALIAASFLLGLSLIFIPLVARNIIVGAPALAMMTNRQFFFIMANAPDMEPFFPYNLVSPWVGRIMAQTGGETIPVILATIRAHGSFINYVGFLLLKAAALFTPHPGNDNGLEYPYFYLHSMALKASPVHFELIAPLALAGAVIAGRSWKQAPIYVLAAIFAMPLVVFITMARYRAPLEAALIPLAGAALSRLIPPLAQRKAPAILAAGALTLLAFFPIIPVPTAYAYQFPGSLFYQAPIRKALEEKRYGDAARIYDDMFNYEKEYGIGKGAIPPERAQTARWFAGLLLDQARAFKLAGNPAKEMECRAHAAAIMKELAGLRGTRRSPW